jgi:hypothetical protein
VKYWDFDAFEPVFLADIRYSIYGAIAIGSIGCNLNSASDPLIRKPRQVQK